MRKLLERLEGIACHIDDVLVVEKDQEQHDTRLVEVLKWTEAAEPSATQCELSKPNVKFLSHGISKKVVQADPEQQHAKWSHYTNCWTWKEPGCGAQSKDEPLMSYKGTNETNSGGLCLIWAARSNYNSRIIVPKLMQQETLQKIHSGHLGKEKCKKCTATLAWWPGVMQQISQLVQNCTMCVKETRQVK